jgi:hypothetical protein
VHIDRGVVVVGSGSGCPLLSWDVACCGVEGEDGDGARHSEGVAAGRGATEREGRCLTVACKVVARLRAADLLCLEQVDGRRGRGGRQGEPVGRCGRRDGDGGALLVDVGLAAAEGGLVDGRGGGRVGRRWPGAGIGELLIGRGRGCVWLVGLDAAVFDAAGSDAAAARSDGEKSEPVTQEGPKRSVSLLVLAILVTRGTRRAHTLACSRRVRHRHTDRRASSIPGHGRGRGRERRRSTEAYVRPVGVQVAPAEEVREARRRMRVLRMQMRWGSGRQDALHACIDLRALLDKIGCFRVVAKVVRRRWGLQAGWAERCERRWRRWDCGHEPSRRPFLYWRALDAASSLLGGHDRGHDEGGRLARARGRGGEWGEKGGVVGGKRRKEGWAGMGWDMDGECAVKASAPSSSFWRAGCRKQTARRSTSGIEENSDMCN